MNVSWASIGQTFKDFTIDYKPKDTIYRDELEALLEVSYPGIKIYLMNPYYGLLSKEQYNKFFKRDQTDQRIWTENDNCWCFATQVWLNARRKMGNIALGTFHTIGHAVNVYVTDEREVITREPQDDSFYVAETKQHISM